MRFLWWKIKQYFFHDTVHFLWYYEHIGKGFYTMTKATTGYDHIHSNNIKTIFLVALFPCIFAALIFLFTWFVAPMEDAINTTISVAIPTFAICAIWILISWAFGDTMMLNIAGAQEISETDKQYRKIFHLVGGILHNHNLLRLFLFSLTFY